MRCAAAGLSAAAPGQPLNRPEGLPTAGATDINKARTARAGKTYSRSGAGGPPHFRGRQGQLLQRAALHLTGEPFGEDWQE